MINLKKHENDKLMEYLLNVIEMLKKTILEEKDLPKLLNLLEIENILKQEEQKVIDPLQKCQAQIPSFPKIQHFDPPLQGINGSSILTIKNYLD